MESSGGEGKLKPEIIIYDDENWKCKIIYDEEFIYSNSGFDPNINQQKIIPFLERNEYKLFMITHIKDDVNRWYWKLEAKAK